jgi:DNA-binding CsgD family transcriptional regulator
MNIQDLNEQERRVFDAIGKGTRASKIAKDMKIKVQTVATYRGRILMKLGLKSTGDIIKAFIFDNFKDFESGITVSELADFLGIKR